MKQYIIRLLVVMIYHNIAYGQYTNFKKIEDSVAVLMDRHHMVGLAIAVIKDNEIIYTKGFGYGDMEEKNAVDEHTIFGIGSITKSFTATLLGIFEEEGTIDLTNSPIDYIPELSFYNDLMDSTLEIRHLLSHSTGMPSLSTEASSVLFESNIKDDLIPRLNHLPPIARVGDRFIYNNFMYTLAGILSERITKDSWEDSIRQLILKPLGMNRIFVGIASAKQKVNFSRGFAVCENKPCQVMPEHIKTRSPAGDIYSSVSDMANWVRLWLHQGGQNDQQIIPHSYVQQAIRPQQIISSTPRSRNSRLANFSHYGYGWFINGYRGYYKVEHSGGISGYSANIAFYPTEDRGIVILTNQTTSNACFHLTDIISDELLGVQTTDYSSNVYYGSKRAITPIPEKMIMNTEEPPAHSLQDFCGQYQHPGFGTINIFLKNDVLYAEFPFTTYRLEHLESNSFTEQFTIEVPLVVGLFMQFDFVQDDLGQIDGLMLNLDENPVEFKKM